jgi:glycosidase
MPERDESTTTSRRALLAASLAGIGGLAGCSSGDGDSTTTVGSDGTTGTATPTTTTGSGTAAGGLLPSEVPQAEVRGDHHPGPPRFTSVGAEALGNLLHGRDVQAELSGVSGDLAPFNPVHGESFSWSVTDAPADSGVSLEDTPVVHLEPDVPGEYTLELDAPDGTHELTVRAFPEEDPEGPQPTVTVAGRAEGDQYVVEADPTPSPEADRDPEDLDVEFYVDDRDRDAFEGELSVDGHAATLPADAVTDTVRVHAVAVGDRHSVADYVRIDADGSITHPNDPPEWIRDATMYEIFVRGFGEDVTFQYLQDQLEYIDEMDVDVVWLTPVLESHSHANPGVPGGPHGYDITDYFDTADALGPREAYEAFVDACHERDIKVVFDLVINHTAREHPYFQAARNGTNVADANQEFFYDMYEWLFEGRARAYFGWRGIPIVNYDTLALRSWMLSIVDEWQAVVDGFRCDVAWGVPRSFWMEFRERVKAEDEEFLLLDETVPWHSDFAEAQFDIHFDYGLFETLGAIGGGSEPATALHDVPADRRAKGYPEHTTFVNYIENHDEDRYLAGAEKRAQMAAGAATFTLPGTPMIYYGQETGLTGTRETMNWDSMDEDLTAHYESLIETTDSLSALSDDAAFHAVELADRPTGTVAYGRESDEEQVLVVLNFGSSDSTVSVPEGVETTDLLTGEDVSAGEGDVTVESAAILRADGAELA